MKKQFVAICVLFSLVLLGVPVCSPNKALTRADMNNADPYGLEESVFGEGSLVPEFVESGQPACDKLRQCLEGHVLALKSLVLQKDPKAEATILSINCERRSMTARVYFSATSQGHFEEMIAVIGLSIGETGIISGSVIEVGKKLNDE